MPPADASSCRKCYSICRNRCIPAVLFNRTLWCQSEHMRHQLKLKPKALQIAHQSEIVALKKQITTLQRRIDELDQLLTNAQSATSLPAKISIPTERGLVFLDKADILYCQASGNYTYLFTEGEKYMVSKSIKWIVDMVKEVDFVRCHQSYFVNLKKITSIDRSDGMHIVLCNDARVPVSRRNKQEVLRRMLDEK